MQILTKKLASYKTFKVKLGTSPLHQFLTLQMNSKTNEQNRINTTDNCTIQNNMKSLANVFFFEHFKTNFSTSKLAKSTFIFQQLL